MRITEKVLVLFLPIFLLSVVAMTLWSRHAAEQELIADVASAGHALSLQLEHSPVLVQALRTGQEGRLLSHLLRLQEGAGAEYVMVLDVAGRVVAHTNVAETGKMYDDDFTRAAVASQEPLEGRIDRGERQIMDIAMPVWEVSTVEAGEEYLLLGHAGVLDRRRLGTLRLGMPLDAARATADRISLQVLWIVTCVNLLGMGLSLFYLRSILRPMRQMVRATERIAGGQLGETVPILSRDEMGDLAHSFNRMSRALAATTVSADFLDSVVDNMREVLIVVHTDGSIRRINRATSDLLGHAEKEILGRSASHLFATEGGLFTPEGLFDLDQEEGILSREALMRARDGGRIPVLLSVAPFHDRHRHLSGFIATAADITARIQAEAETRRSLREKEILLKEIHHRVKNNLQIISSLLNLQSSHFGAPRALALFNDSQSRIRSMALIHEKLYLSEDLDCVDFHDYLTSLSVALYQTYRQEGQEIRIDVDGRGVHLGIDQAIPCGLIVNELVSNALKHGLADRRKGVVSVAIQQEEGRHYRLDVVDDGAGLPPDFDLRSEESLGLKLVRILTQQLKGTIDIAGGSGGACFTLRFAVAEAEDEGS